MGNESNSYISNEEKLLLNFCDCLIEAITDNSSHNEITENARNFILTYKDHFIGIDDFFFQTEILYLINEYIDKIIADFMTIKVENRQNPFEFYSKVNMDSYINLMQNEIGADYPSCFNIIKCKICNKLETYNRIFWASKDLYDRRYSEMLIRWKKLENDIDKKTEQLDNNIKYISQKRKNEFIKMIDESEKEIHKNSITILGIFSAVVLTTNAAISFYTSIIEAFGASSSYKVLLVLLVVGLIINNVLLGLFYYLEKIRNGKKLNLLLKEKVIDTGNNETSKRKRKVYRPLIPFAISNIVLILLIVVLAILWIFGVIEWRNQKISSYFDKKPVVSGTVINSEEISISETANINEKNPNSGW